MIFNRYQGLITTTLLGALCVPSVYAQQASTEATLTPGFNTYIPQDVLTPSTIPTRIGTPGCRCTLADQAFGGFT
ncbi:UNVERIFIED_ORG: hypothetical protein M2414_005349 [Rahnella aquatilis]